MNEANGETYVSRIIKMMNEHSDTTPAGPSTFVDLINIYLDVTDVLHEEWRNDLDNHPIGDIDVNRAGYDNCHKDGAGSSYA